MMTIHRWTFYGILVLNVILVGSLLNLTMFANKGARFTAADGAREKAERIQGDQDLQARIDALHCREWGQE